MGKYLLTRRELEKSLSLDLEEEEEESKGSSQDVEEGFFLS